jgi:uncharacterized protein YacL
MQTKKNSLIESITNTISGFIISLLIQLLIYPIMGIPVSFHQNIIITFVFTTASILRGYLVRRIFNSTQQPKQLNYERNNERQQSHAKGF